MISDNFSFFLNPPLVIPDGDIPTTKIIAKVLKEAFGDVEIRLSSQLFGTDISRRYIVLSRLCHPEFEWIPSYFSSRKISYAYFLDDNFWELTEEVDPHHASFYQQQGVLDTLDRFIRKANLVIVMSKRLLAYIKSRHPQSNVHYIAPGFDIKTALGLAMKTATSNRDDEVLRIGYPTSRRVNITPLLLQIVNGIHEKYRNKVIFEFVGWMPDDLKGRQGVIFHQHLDRYEDYLSFILSRNWDIGIAPVIQGVFESFKTQVKYREYAGCGIPGIYSNVPPYTDYIVHEETGILVENEPEKWISAIERTLFNPGIRKKISEKSFSDVEENFNQTKTASQLRELMEENLHFDDGQTH